MGDRDPWIAIMVAAANGRSLRLSADDVEKLAGDNAIETAAANGLDEKDWPQDNGGPDWKNIKPRRRDRIAKNFAI